MPRSLPRGESVDAKYFSSLSHKDTPVWFALAVAGYACETGDLAFLTGTNAKYAGSQIEDSILDHVIRGLDFMVRDVGRHGLSLLGGGDWTDPLDAAGVKGSGESVWLTEALVLALKQTMPVLDACGRREKATEWRNAAAGLSDAINRHGWDGQWYRYGYTDDGNVIGSAADSEARIWLNSQSWAILAGVADDERTRQVLDAVERHLDGPHGIAVLTPPYTRYRQDIGELSTKAAGVAENGSCYNHAGTFMAAARLRAGKGAAGVRTLARILPTNPENPADNSQMVPIFVPNEYNGPDAVTAGRAANKFFSGTCAWMLMIAANDLAGARAAMDGLTVDPCMPADWRSMQLVRPWRSCTYDIRITKPLGIEKGKVVVMLDGKKLPGNVIPPPQESGRVFTVNVRVVAQAGD